ncbi:MAG TPA: ATP-binding protein [Candidatus Saccharimonadales bacterium]|jgi:PAS domain S-box-containing protein|nr:ATP-binding protein [Candidatus Saccharimonadales bacterium]
MAITDQTFENFKLDHERLVTLINSINDGVIAIDENKRIVLYNAAALNLLDLNTVLTDRPLVDVLKIYDKDKNPIDIDSLINLVRIPTSTRDYLLHRDDKSTVNLYLNIAPVHLSYGQVGEQGFVLVLRDITNEKSLEEERDEFISVVSHELRTPVTIAEGDLSNAQFVLKSDPDIEQVKQFIDEAYSQILFLAELINDLSTLSRAERKTLKIDITTIDPAALINEIVNNHRPEVTKKGIEISAQIEPSIRKFQSSELYVKEIIENFITNAIKYTQKGRIIVGAKRQAQGIEFWVTDTGIGISRADQEKIFGKFYRADDYRTRHTRGTGLGLYISKKLTNLLGGEIDFKSELNVGSTFSAVIPDRSENPSGTKEETD